MPTWYLCWTANVIKEQPTIPGRLLLISSSFLAVSPSLLFFFHRRLKHWYMESTQSLSFPCTNRSPELKPLHMLVSMNAFPGNPWLVLIWQEEFLSEGRLTLVVSINFLLQQCLRNEKQKIFWEIPLSFSVIRHDSTKDYFFFSFFFSFVFSFVGELLPRPGQWKELLSRIDIVKHCARSSRVSHPWRCPMPSERLWILSQYWQDTASQTTCLGWKSRSCDWRHHAIPIKDSDWLQILTAKIGKNGKSLLQEKAGYAKQPMLAKGSWTMHPSYFDCYGILLYYYNTPVNTRIIVVLLISP